MPETLVEQIEEFNDAQKHNLLTSYLTEDIKRLGRQVQIKLLTEFIEFSIAQGYGSVYDQKELIEKFLDERNKK